MADTLTHLVLCQAIRNLLYLGTATDHIHKFTDTCGRAFDLVQGLCVIQIQLTCTHDGKAAVSPTGVGYQIVVLVQILVGKVVCTYDGADIDIILTICRDINLTALKGGAIIEDTTVEALFTTVPGVGGIVVRS